jgi:hypothetical protein
MNDERGSLSCTPWQTRRCTLVPTRPQKPNQFFFPFDLQVERPVFAMILLNFGQNFIKTDFAFGVFWAERQLRHHSPDGSLFGGDSNFGFFQGIVPTQRNISAEVQVITAPVDWTRGFRIRGPRLERKNQNAMTFRPGKRASKHQKALWPVRRRSLMIGVRNRRRKTPRAAKCSRSELR